MSRGRSVQLSSSPLLASKTPVWRSKLIVAAMALGFMALIGRAAQVQVIDNDFFIRQGEVRFARTLELPANRGRVVDRNGVLLASSVPAPSIWANPEGMERDPDKLRQLARLLKMTPAELNQRIKNEEKTFVWLRRQLDEPVAKQVLALGIKGVYDIKEYKRLYPEGEAAAHIVGFTNVEDKGQEGVELIFQEQLSGQAGSRRVIKDRLGRVVEAVGETAHPVDGQNLQLSIDSKVQFYAYQTLRDAVKANKAKAGSVVVLDTQTGEILALANYPSYVPDQRVNLSGEQLRNRALTDSFEPGSTIKPFTVALAMEQGLVKPGTLIETAPGRINITGSTIRDVKAYGMLTVSEVIQKSSNVGTVKMAMEMQPRAMWEMFSELGFGQRPDLPFPGVVSGRLRPYKSWRPVEQATMSYGYGMSSSLFQVARAYTVFARDGEIVPATLIKSEGKVAGTRVMSVESARAMRQMLHLTAGPGGTAPQAQTVGYSVGGKSGTARKQEGKGYAVDKFRSFFVGIAPIDQPRIVVAVMVDEPSNEVYFGGAVAGPVFSQTVQQTLRLMGVQPDMAVTPQIVAQAVEESF